MDEDLRNLTLYGPETYLGPMDLLDLILDTDSSISCSSGVVATILAKV